MLVLLQVYQIGKKNKDVIIRGKRAEINGKQEGCHGRFGNVCVGVRGQLSCAAIPWPTSTLCSAGDGQRLNLSLTN